MILEEEVVAKEEIIEKEPDQEVQNKEEELP